MIEQQLHAWLADGLFDKIVEYAGRRKRALSYLTALTYAPQPLIAWRAVEVMGLASGRIAENDPEYVRNHLRRLMWSLNDESGSIGWRAPEAMGEIIRNQPELFGEFVPIVISLLDMEAEDAPRFRPGALWAIGRLARVIPSQLQPALPRVLLCLDDPDPQARGCALWCLRELGYAGAVPRFERLLNDGSPVELYLDGHITTVSIAQLARQLPQQEPDDAVGES